MSVVTVKLRDMIRPVQAGVRALLLAASMKGGVLVLRDCLVTYEPRTNVVVITQYCPNCGRMHAARFELDAPDPAYRWN